MTKKDIYPRQALTLEKATAVLARIEQTDGRLPARVRDPWRWRLLYLRAVIDAEAAAQPDRRGVVSDRQAECFRELTRLSCAENSESAVKPPRRLTQ